MLDMNYEIILQSLLSFMNSWIFFSSKHCWVLLGKSVPFEDRDNKCANKFLPKEKNKRKIMVNQLGFFFFDKIFTFV